MSVLDEILVGVRVDMEQRQRAMPKLASLVRTGGAMIMKIRHGPVPPGRRMFEIPAEETIELAQMQDLHPVLNLRTQSSLEINRNAVTSAAEAASAISAAMDAW